MRFLYAGLLVLLLSVDGCALNPGESRKITAWGFWAVVLGEPVGIGYWHSERGPSTDIASEQSAQPPGPVSQRIPNPLGIAPAETK